MRNRRYPRYPDDTDYTTNSPSYYDDLARKQKLIKVLAEKIWEYDEILKTSLEEVEAVLNQVIDKIGEGFNQEIYDLLILWVEDGTLDHIINETLMNQKADKIELKALETQLTTELENNITLVNQNIQQIGDRIEGFVNVAEYGAVGDGVTDDTQAILNALSENKKVEFSRKTYVMTERLILSSHILKGQFDGDTFTPENTTRILFKDMPNVESAVHVAWASRLDNILFELDTWTDNTAIINGLTGGRKIIASNCSWNSFTGNGALLYRSGNGTPYHSNFTNCCFDYNKKHGLVIGNGMNALTIINPTARWNGTTRYKKAPDVTNGYDGIHINGQIEGLPLNPNLKFEPQGNTIIDGDMSYNSRYGVNHEYGNENIQIGGYIEENLVSNVKVNNVYGTIILNPVTPTEPDITTLANDPDFPIRGVNRYPNHIIVRGKQYGNGTKNRLNKYQQNFISQALANGANFTEDPDGLSFIFDSKYDGIGNNQAFSKFTNRHHLNAKNAVFGTETPNTDKGLWFYPQSDWETSPLMNFINYPSKSSDTSQSGLFSARGTGGSSSITALRLSAHSVTNRSINAGGTVNTSGADYAEYVEKEDPNVIIEKGEIAGINSEGKLTKEYDKAISFVVKSTNPAFVGGDKWTKNLPLEPSVPVRSEESDEEFEEKITTYNEEKQRFDELLESERRKFDRVAFCGICPVNIQGAIVGDYIIPEKDSNSNSIKGKGISNPTFEEYKRAIGRVKNIGDDGRPIIIVKTI